MYSEDQDQTWFNQGQIHSKYHSNIESPFRAPHHHAQLATFMIFLFYGEGVQYRTDMTLSLD